MCRYSRLDGSTNRVQRMIDIAKFQAPGSATFIYILNTRAGGLGVNLQSADTCILYDSDWNPQVWCFVMLRKCKKSLKRSSPCIWCLSKRNSQVGSNDLFSALQHENARLEAPFQIQTPTSRRLSHLFAPPKATGFAGLAASGSPASGACIQLLRK